MAMFRFKRGQHTSLRVVKMHYSHLVSHVLQCWGWIDSWLLNLWKVCVWWELGKNCFFDADAVDPCGFTARSSSSQAFFGGIVLRENFQIVWTRESRTDSNKPLIIHDRTKPWSHLLCFFKHLTCQYVSEHTWCWNLCSLWPFTCTWSQDIYGLLWSNWMSKLLKLLSLRTKNRFYRSYRMVFLVWHWCRIGVWLCSHKKWSIFPSSFPRSSSYQKWGDISIYIPCKLTNNYWLASLHLKQGWLGRLSFHVGQSPMVWKFH